MYFHFGFENLFFGLKILKFVLVFKFDFGFWVYALNLVCGMNLDFSFGSKI